MKRNIYLVLGVAMLYPSLSTAELIASEEHGAKSKLAELCCEVNEKKCKEVHTGERATTEWSSENYYRFLITAATAREAIDECKGLSVSPTHNITPCVENDIQVIAKPTGVWECSDN